MANVWNYVGNTYSGRDKVRAIIGDVDVNDQLLNDYEIDGMLAVYSNETEAAAHLCRNMAARFAFQGNIKVDDYSFENIKRAEYFNKLSMELFKQVHGTSRPIVAASPSFGGVSKTNKNANDQNTDNVEPSFYRGQFEDLNREDLEDIDDD